MKKTQLLLSDSDCVFSYVPIDTLFYYIFLNLPTPVSQHIAIGQHVVIYMLPVPAAYHETAVVPLPLVPSQYSAFRN